MLFVLILSIISMLCLLISSILLIAAIKYSFINRENLKSTSEREAIIISGCDSGIGLVLAKYFYKITNYTIICCFLYPELSDGHKTLEELKSQRIILVELDLTSQQHVDSLVSLIDKAKLEGKFDKVVALINNAGIMAFGEFDWLTWNQILSQIDVNLVGTIRLTRAMLPYIIESKGRIINVSSVNDTTVFPGLSVYSATKSAISIFSRGLGYELRKFQAHVVTVRLGDFAKLTNIMSKHSVHQENMWKEMSPKKQAFYKKFFDEFNSHLLKNYGMTSPKDFEDSSLFKDFKRALLSECPPTNITCTSLGFKIFYIVIELLPLWLQYYLLDLLLQMGFRWRPPHVDS